MRTPICDLLGIDLPLVQAPIGPAAVPRLVASVSSAGALGMLALTWFDDPAAAVRETATMTNSPFGGNFVISWDQRARIESTTAPRSATRASVPPIHRPAQASGFRGRATWPQAMRGERRLPPG